jgi:hypothetical protein
MERILTVTTPAASTALTTLAAVQAELGSAATGVADAVLEGLIADASSAIADFCRRVLGRETVLETFRRTGRRQPEALALARCPVASIATVTEDGTALATDGWELDAEKGFLYRLTDDERSWWTGTKIAVAYAGGWLLPEDPSADLPESIRRACLITVATWFQARGRDAMLRSESAEGISSHSWLDPRAEHGGLPFQAAALLKPHQRPVL